MRPLLMIVALAAATALLAPGCARKAKPSTIEALAHQELLAAGPR